MVDKSVVGAHETRRRLTNIGTGTSGQTEYAETVAAVTSPVTASTPLGSQSITVTTSATLLSALCSGAALPAGATWAWLQPRGGDIAMTDLSTDTPGSPAAAGVGLKISQDQMFPLVNGLAGVKLVAASSVGVTVQFYS